MIRRATLLDGFPNAAQKRRRGQPEQQLQIALVEVLRLVLHSSVTWSAFPAGGGGKTRGAFLKAMGLRPGVGDLMFMWETYNDVVGLFHLRVAFVELKVGKNKQSDDQETFEGDVMAIGAYYAVCRSVDEALAFLHSVDCPMRNAKVSA